ncbi:hypothetical protein OVA03_14680 [Asticcacaulis sp. SL142]|uniref:hypothetical protein n=1 Tax=Asticcacaulis sp. SL142 TaxID=2995155 RepID=UPI00226C7F01|nr:hypothetical protein [Asticcacaulis sp. SL142]WAC47932.1 hypothetical protein OVA03_14680 [Asticcacaulis sp. SL142]
MAKAIFHRRQRVWVEPVGTWALIDKVNPIWAKGFDEPIRVTYDCGLGREFRGEELKSESDVEQARDIGQWRLMRARNKWHSAEESGHHPFPGTYPVVVTDPNDWGGWRVPGAEYDRDPALIEMQARLITLSPKLLKLVKDLVTYVRQETEDLPEEVMELAKRAENLRHLVETEAPEAGVQKVQPADPAAR